MGAACDVEMRMKRCRRFIPWVVMIGAAGAAALWVKPWADSVMTASVIVTTDDGAPSVVYETRRRFSDGARRLPVFRAEIDLGAYSGQLLRFDIEGNVARREVEGGSTGYVGCEAELVSPDGVLPVEFAGWQQGAEIGLHPGPVGPQACRVNSQEDAGFAYARKGTLWYAMRVPTGARLWLRLRPVPSVSIEGRPEAYLPQAQPSNPRARLPARPKERPPDVFIYVIDALRADHLGCYGYDRATSPLIDAFAGEATFYRRAMTPTTWTRPSVATMLSGLYPSVHGAMHNTDGLAEWPVLLPEILREAGYATACFTTNLQIGENFGFNQGYDRFVLEHFASAQWAVSQTADFLGALDPARPAFVYLHTIEPHDPYTPRPESRKRFDRGYQGTCDGSAEGLNAAGRVNPKLSADDIAHLIDLYDAEVYDADRGFTDFVQMLKRSGRFDEALVILTADHGEAFAEHDTLSHGRNLNVEEMHVPLIIRFPRGRHGGMQLEERVGLHDLLPTILAEVGAGGSFSYQLPGEELPPGARTSRRREGELFYAELSQFGSNDLDLVAVIDEDGYKRVIDVSVAPRETAAGTSLGLWDTGRDPAEAEDLSAKLPARAAYDEQLIARWLLAQKDRRDESAAGAPPRVHLDDETRRQLRDLGYIGDAGGGETDDPG